MSLVELRGVVREYGRRPSLAGGGAVRAVDGVSLSIAAGQVLGLVGESGCGKSTTGRLALGLETPQAGSVRFAGQAMPPPHGAAWRALRARMQMVFQDPLAALDRRLPIATQIAEPLVIHAIGTPGERAERVAALLRAVGLGPELGGRFAHELSGGQRQRAVLARALATRPAFLVCDEPVAALDVSIQAQVINQLAELQAAEGLAMLFISHDLRVVRQLAEVIAVMYLGRVVEQGRPDAVLARPLHPYTQALVSAIPGKHRGTRIILAGEPPDPARRPPGCAFAPRCRLAEPRCHATAPALRSLPDGRRVACHLVGDDALSTRPAGAG